VKIVLFGGAGHVGTYLADNLWKLAIGLEEIIIVDNIQSQRYDTIYGRSKARNIKVKVKSLDELAKIDIVDLESCDILLHLAGETNPSLTDGTLEHFKKLNFETTKVAIEIARQTKLPIIFTSSTSVYDRSGDKLNESEDIYNPPNTYAKCKYLEEQLFKNYFLEGGKGAILRMGTIHGFSRGMKFHTAINKLSLQAILSKKLTVWRTALNQFRPYLSLGDLQNAINALWATKQFSGETYNLATGHYTLGQILNIFKDIFGHNIPVQIIESQAMNDLSFTVSTDKFKALGFTFSGSLREDIIEVKEKFDLDSFERSF
jgi:nucleoside-diphosphate-sugar epimerase